jgi:hypothetical protein
MRGPGCWAALSILLCAAVAFGQDSPNALTAKESAEGWILLFDGKSLNGWDVYLNGDWKAEKGAMLCGGTVASWIGTKGTFADFDLRLEFRGPAKINSGVFLRSDKVGQPHVTGYELQIWDYQPAGFLTGSLVGSVKAEPVKILPNEWNRYEISARGDHFIILLNGKKVLDARDSKHSAGVIGLQCQPDNRIEFRNLKLKPVKQ